MIQMKTHKKNINYKKAYAIFILIVFITGLFPKQQVFAASPPVFQSVASGISHSLAVKSDGTLWATGLNTNGQLGDGTIIQSTIWKQTLTNVMQVSAGLNHSLALKNDGTVWVTGYNGYGQLGDGTNAQKTTWIQTITNVKQISAGDNYSLALKNDGTLWVTGDNTYGQLGDGTGTQKTTWKQVLTNVSQFSGGSNFSLALKTDGTVWATGYNGQGTFGDGTVTQSIIWKQTLTGVSQITVGSNHSLALKTDGTLWATGYNGYGQLGDGTTVQKTTWKQTLTGVTQISAGSNYSLALKNDGTVFTTGINGSGQLGDGTTVQKTAWTQTLTNVSQISAGRSQSLAIKTDNTLWATGLNTNGQLGDATTTNATTWKKTLTIGGNIVKPTLTLTPSTTAPTNGNVVITVNATASGAGNSIASTKLVSGTQNVIFFMNGGGIDVIASNYTATYNGIYTVYIEDLSGNYTTQTITISNITTTPQTTPGIQGSVTSGSGHSLSLKSDGTLWSTGLNNYGQLGDGTVIQSTIWKQTLTNVMQVSSGLNHSLALKNDGTVWVTGYNGYGQLGDGTNAQKTTWIQTITNVKQISAGDNYSLALKNDGTLWITGDNTYGQFGDGTGVQKTTWKQVLTDVSQISGGSNFSLALRTDGTVWATGYNGQGTFGDGTVTQSIIWKQTLTGVTQISAGSNHSLALKTNGTLWVTGYNGYGQLGDGTTVQKTAWTQTLTNVTQISAGTNYSLALKNDNTVWSTGINGSGQLGDGTNVQKTAWKQTLTNVNQISAGKSQSLAIKTDNTLWATGLNTNGQLGDATTTNATTWKKTLTIGGNIVKPTLTLTPSTTAPTNGNVIITINSTASGAGNSIAYTKVASGIQDILFFMNGGGINVSSTEYTASYNGTYTVYIEDLAGNATIKTITISNIITTPQTTPGSQYSIAGGDKHSLSLKSDGTLWATGYNTNGQLGDGTLIQSTIWKQTLTNVIQVATGAIHSLALKADGTVWATGYNGNGQLGDGTTVQKTTWVQTLTNVKQISAGYNHSLALKNDGTLWATGYNPYGALGDGTGAYKTTWVQVLTDVTQVSGGSISSLALRTDGTVWATGYNAYGQLGDGTTNTSYLWKQTLTGVSQISIGDLQSLALKNDGTVWSTGYNGYGQLGDGTTNTSNSWKQTLVGVTQISAGQNHSLALKADGTVWTTGHNAYGQLGNSTTVSKSVWNQTLTGVKQIATGQNSSLAIKTDNTLWATGVNTNGQLGIGTITNSNIWGKTLTIGGNFTKPTITLTPSTTAPITGNVIININSTAIGSGNNIVYTKVASGIQDILFFMNGGGIDTSYSEYTASYNGTYTVYVEDLAGNSTIKTITISNIITTPQITPGSQYSITSGDKHSLSLKADGTLWATGYNTNGQLGDGTLIQSTIWKQTLTNVIQVSTGVIHSLALKADGTVWATGYNGNGQLGDGTTTQKTTWVQTLTNVKQISAGYNHSLALKNDGTLWATGYNPYGALGDGTGSQSTTWKQVLTDVIQVSGGSISSLALRTDGTVWATGYNAYGQLGDGTTNTSYLWKQTLTGVSQISMGELQSLALKIDGTLWASGYNGYGQLGDATTNTSNFWKQTLTGVIQISAGKSHSLALKSDGILWATGYNAYGQLGDATNVSKSVWNQTLTGVKQIAAGQNSSLAIKTDDTLWATGVNTNGQLGDGTITNSNIWGNTLTIGGNFTKPTLTLTPSITEPTNENVIININSTAIGSGNNIVYTKVASGIQDILFFMNGGGIDTSDSAYTASYNGTYTVYVEDLAGNSTIKTITISNIITTPQTTPGSQYSITSGDKHSLSLKADGTLWATGLNTNGQLGDGTLIQNTIWEQTLNNVIQVSAGTNHSLALKADGTLWATGYNGYGQLGDGTTTQKTTWIQTLTNVKQISAGYNHSLALKNDGTLWATGYNPYGALGDGTGSSRTTWVQVLTDVTQVSGGSISSLALRTDGTVWSTGYNAYGQLGDGTTNTSYLWKQTLTGVSQISMGELQSLALRTDGTVWATGYNAYGQLGDGTTGSKSVWNQTLSGVSQISAGKSHSLALRTDGTLWATGYNSYGQLGDATNVSKSVWNQTLTKVMQIASGQNSSLAIKTDGTLWDTGVNTNGQLGDGTITNSNIWGKTLTLVENITPPTITLTPSITVPTTGNVLVTINATAIGSGNRITLTKVSSGIQDILFFMNGGGINVIGSAYTASYNGTYTVYVEDLAGNSTIKTITISNIITTPQTTPGSQYSIAGGDKHSLSLKADGTLWATGYNYNGQLGDGTVLQSIIWKQTLTNVIQVATGENHSLALKSDGTVWATGYNGYGQLGDGTTSQKTTWIQTLTDVKQISVGHNHSLALKNDGTLWATGRNDYGALGNGTGSSKTTWVQVLTDVTQISGGILNSIALRTDGTVWTTGYNSYGELGDGTTNTSYLWKQTLTGVSQIAMGYLQALALKTDGTVWVTGYNNYGQLGDGTSSQKTTWIQTLTGVSQIAAGYSHSLALKSDGTVWVTGYNGYGQLGDATNVSRTTWKETLTNVSQIASGQNNSLAIKTDGTLWATGLNANGQFGDGTTVNSNIWKKTLTIGGNLTSPEITLTPSNTAPTTDNVVITINATAIGNGNRISNLKFATGTQYAAYFITGGTPIVGTTFIATTNGIYTVYAIDTAGNTTVQTITISNILSVAPVITIGDYSTAPTNKDVVVTATTDKGTLNTTTHIFTENGSFDFVATDELGNISTEIVTVSNIYTTAPTASVAGNPTVWTNKIATITITAFDGGSSLMKYLSVMRTSSIVSNGIKNIILPDGSVILGDTATFIANVNGNYAYSIEDNAGNITNGNIVVDRIDMIAPDVPTLSGDITNIINGKVPVTISYPVDAYIKQYKINNGSWLNYTATLMVIDQDIVYARCQDVAGNTSTENSLIVYSVWPPTITILPYNTNTTNKNIIVTATVNKGTLNTGTHTFTENGSFTFTATDIYENIITKTVTITNIDKVVPIITINPYNTNSTNQDVIVTATTDKGTLNTLTHTFTVNGNFNFVATDEAGNITTKNVTITNIDKVGPVITILPYSTTATDQPITVTASVVEGTLNQENYTFTKNGSFTFIATDSLGNISSKVVTITNIKPMITINPYNTDYTNEDLIVTATSENATLNQDSYTFTTNGDFIFIATNEYGDTNSKKVTITNIDKTAPTLILSQTPSTPTNKNVTVNVSATDNGSGMLSKIWANDVQDISYFTNGGTILTGSSFIVTDNGIYTVYAVDKLGNETVETITISNIDRIAPDMPILTEDVTTTTNQNVYVNIDYPSDATIKQYKIGEGSIWKNYASPVEIDTNTAIYAKCTDLAGNVSDISSLDITNINKDAPIITIAPYNINPTNKNIIVTATVDHGILEQSSYTFTDNGEFTFIATDEFGNMSMETVTITNIDKIPPVITIVPYDTDITDLDIIVTATTNEGTLNEDTHTFIKNGSFTFISTDSAGNVSNKIVTITNIDKEAPVITINPYNTEATNQNVIVTATTDKGTLNTTTHTFTANGSFTFVATDILTGKSTSEIVTITNIDKNAPIITIAPYNTKQTGLDITVSASVNKGTLNQDSYTFTENGSFTFTAIDSLGNTSSKIVNITNIDKNEPIITIAPYNTNPTNQNIVVLATVNNGNLNQSSYTFTKNGEFTFTASNDLGYTASKTVTITNINKVAPIITIAPYNTEATNQNVSVIATTDKGTLNEKVHTFTNNGSFTFIAIDEYGNTSSKVVTINNINKNQITITTSLGSYDRILKILVINAVTDIGTLNFSTHTFTEDGSFNFTATDSLGNTTTKTAVVVGLGGADLPIITIIDNDNDEPEALILSLIITGVPTAYTTNPVILTLNATALNGISKIILADGTEVNASTATFTVLTNGTYTFKAIDTLGNETTQTVIIDKIITATAPKITAVKNLLVIKTDGDNMTGVTSVMYKINTGEWTEVTISKINVPSGQSTIQSKVVYNDGSESLITTVKCTFVNGVMKIR